MFDIDFETPRNLRQIDGEGLFLRTPQKRDYPQWAALRRKNTEFLKPYEPLWPDNHLAKSGFLENLKLYRQNAKTGKSFIWYIHCPIDDTHSNSDQKTQIIGSISLSNIRHGIIQTGTFGYWLGEEYTKKGLMHKALQLVIDTARKELKLTRFEAATLKANKNSISLLKKLKFEQEGEAKAYLRINGQWQDHLLFGLNFR